MIPSIQVRLAPIQPVNKDPPMKLWELKEVIDRIYKLKGEQIGQADVILGFNEHPTRIDLVRWESEDKFPFSLMIRKRTMAERRQTLLQNP
jgi:hypothetical protein